VKAATHLTITTLASQPGLVHGFSRLEHGSMRRSPDDASVATPGRRAFAAALGADPDRLTVAGAVHGAQVARVDHPRGGIDGVDALITDRPLTPLLATFADCYPILLLDPQRLALALVHAGWRGTAAGVASSAVAALANQYGSRPSDLVCGIGPGICGDCYEVGPEVAERFPTDVVRPANSGRFLLDLAAANRDQLIHAGVGPDRIDRHPACTLESADLPSHRRSPDGFRFACLAYLTG
jgi:YfiH family protein